EITGRRQAYYLALLGGAYAAAGQRDRALALLRDLKQRAESEYIAPYHLSFLYMPLGEIDEAISSLEKACAERNALIWWIRDSPAFDALRSHARYPSLVEKVVPA
ncbi:MAG TPA: hypothetical protein VF376_13525, partial [Thermoanaerobaculia bacterium]